MTSIDLRPTREEDGPALFAAFEATLRPCIEWAWGWDDEFQRNGFDKNFLEDTFRIITVDGAIAGGLRTEEQEHLLFVRLIYLLPEFQRRGIGTAVLRMEARRAHAQGKQLHLKVIKINTAKVLYDLLGFIVIAEDDVTYHMRLADSVTQAPLHMESIT
jgi:GNAT superfamily N-acetyltransferase